MTLYIGSYNINIIVVTNKLLYIYYSLMAMIQYLLTNYVCIDYEITANGWRTS